MSVFAALNLDPDSFATPPLDPSASTSPPVPPASGEQPFESRNYAPPVQTDRVQQPERFRSSTSELPDFFSDAPQGASSEPGPLAADSSAFEQPAAPDTLPPSTRAFESASSFADDGDRGFVDLGETHSTAPAPNAAGQSRDDSGSGGGHPLLGPIRAVAPTRPTGVRILDAAALVLAFVLPPIGLIVGIVASIRGRLLAGWTSNLARAAIVVSLVMSVVFALGGAYFWVEGEEARAEAARQAEIAAAHDSVVAESAQFCEALVPYPQFFENGDPDYGWPALDDPAGYLPAIANYGATWQALAPLAPSQILEQTTSFSARVDGIVSIATSLQIANRSGDLLSLHSSDDIDQVAAHVAEYCG